MVSAEFLKQVPVFANVPVSALELVAQGAEERSYGGGETIVAEHQPAAALIIIRSGQARAFRQGDATPIMLGPGTAIGEASLLDGGTIGLSVVALERVDAVAIGPGHLKKLAGNHEAAHVFFRNVAMNLVARLRMVASAYDLALKSASQK